MIKKPDDQNNTNDCHPYPSSFTQNPPSSLLNKPSYNEPSHLTYDKFSHSAEKCQIYSSYAYFSPFKCHVQI